MPIAVDMKNIAEGIEMSYGERMSWLADATKDTHQMMNRISRENKEAAMETNETLKTFHREHEKMSTDLWDFLSSDRDNREKDTAKLMTQIREDISSMKKEVASQLSRFDKERQSMAEQLANFLKESTSSMKKETAELMIQIKGDISSIEKETASLLSGFDRDFKEARQNWQNLARIMAAKRAGKAVTPAKRIEGVPKEEVAEAVASFNAGSLKEQILRLISEAASGISLAKMGTALGIPYVRLAKPASELVNEGKIVKKDSLYFPA